MKTSVTLAVLLTAQLGFSHPILLSKNHYSFDPVSVEVLSKSQALEALNPERFQVNPVFRYWSADAARKTYSFIVNGQGLLRSDLALWLYGGDRRFLLENHDRRSRLKTLAAILNQALSYARSNQLGMLINFRPKKTPEIFYVK